MFAAITAAVSSSPAPGLDEEEAAPTTPVGATTSVPNNNGTTTPPPPGSTSGGGSIMSSSQAQAAYEEVMRKKQVQELKTDLDLLRAKLIRRNALMGEIVKAYHRDIISIKQELVRKETAPVEEKAHYKVNTEVKDNVPSLDLRGYLQLFAPSGNFMRLKPCESCGGQIEILHHESQKMEALAKKCAELEEIKTESEQIIIGYRAQVTQAKNALEQERFRTAIDRQIFEDRVLELKAELAKFDVREINQMRHDIILLRNQNKEQSVKLQRMIVLEGDIEKVLKENANLQKAVLEKERVIASLERDKDLAQELAASSGRKCEILEQDAAKMMAGTTELQKRLKAEMEQAEQLVQNTNRMQKSLTDNRKTEQAMKTKIQQLQKTIDELLEKNDVLKKDLTKALEGIESQKQQSSSSASDSQRRQNTSSPSVSRPSTGRESSSPTKSPSVQGSNGMDLQPDDAAPTEDQPQPPKRASVTNGQQQQQQQISPQRSSSIATAPSGSGTNASLPSDSSEPSKPSLGDQPKSSPFSPTDSPDASPRQIYLVKIPGPQPSPPPVKTHILQQQLPDNRSSNLSAPPPRGRRRSSGTVALTVGSDGSVGITGVHWDDGMSSQGKDKNTSLEERFKQLNAELSEEKSTRDLVEKSFIRVTSRNFFQIDPESSYYDDGDADAKTVNEGNEDPAKKAERVAGVKAHFIQAVQQVLLRQEQGLARAKYENDAIQQLLEENETLTAKLVRAHREKEIAQENLQKASKAIEERIERKAKELIRQGHYQPSQSTDESSTNSTNPAVVVQVDNERIEELMELNLRYEDQLRQLEGHIAELKQTVEIEREKKEKLRKEVQEVQHNVELMENQLEKEAAKTESLREALKEKIQEVSNALTDKNEQAITFNFQMERKQEELEAKQKLLETELTRVESMKKAVTTLLASVMKTCKGMEGSLEKRVSTVELKGVETLIRDPGAKQVARRFDKRDSVVEEEVAGFVEAAKAFDAPLLYLATRINWAFQNLCGYLEGLRNTRKDLTNRVQEGEKNAIQLETRIEELIKSVEDQKVSMQLMVDQKKGEITGWKCTVEELKTEARALNGELKGLRDIDATCRELTAMNEELKLGSERAAQQVQDISDEMTVIRHQNEVLSLTAHKTQTELDTATTKVHDMEVDLTVTRTDLTKTTELLMQVQEVVRREEIRRETSKAVGIQSTPDQAESGVQTEFFVPDMNLRATISLENNKSDRIFVERTMTPAVLMPTVRRCSTVLPSGALLVTGSEQDLYTNMNTTQWPHPSVNMDEPMTGPQPIGTLKQDLADFLTPTLRKGSMLGKTMTMMSMTQTARRTLAPINRR